MDLEILFALLQTVVALAAVIALAYLVLRMARRLNTGGGSLVKIIEKTSLSNHSYLAVAKIGAEYHLISVTSGDIKILKDISADEVEAALEEKRRHFEENPINNSISHLMKRAEEGPVKKLMQARKKQ
jgi:flagellar biogenesis protein FliO